MNEFYNYLSNTEKEFMAIESAYNIELEKNLLAYEYADKIQDIKMMQSDLKVLTESGTYEDIEYLYAEAGKEAEDKKKNIFLRMIDSTVNLITNIIEGIAKLFKGKKEKDVDDALNRGKGKGVKTKDPNKVSSIFSKTIGDFKRLLKPGQEVSDETGEKALKIAGTATAALAALGISVFAGKAVNKARKNTTNILDEMKGMLINFKANLPKGPGVPKVLKGLGQTISSFGKTVTGSFSALIGAIFGGGDNSKDRETPNTEGKNSPEPARDENPAETPGDDKITPESTIDLIDGLGFMESEELEQTMNELDELFASL